MTRKSSQEEIHSEQNTKNEYILETRDLAKNFSGIQALKGISLRVRAGEVHAIVGENGAGKSTFIKILTGVYSPSSGSLRFDGNEYSHFTPEQALKIGISAIYQEFNLVPFLTIAENIFFGVEAKKGIFCDFRKMEQDAKELFREIGMDINPHAVVKDLGIAQQQLVEIVKAISKNARFIIMDEPSAPLTENETKTLHDIVKRLKAKGITVIYISHRLEEVFNMCDRVSVFRDGQYIETKDVADTDRQELISLMVGRKLGEEYPPRQMEPGEAVLEVEKLENRRVHDISFKLYKNEILGLGGLVGAGRTEVARAIFGADAIKSGTVKVKGAAVRIANPSQAFARSVGLLPEDRKRQGVILGLPIRDNITLPILRRISRASFIDTRQEKSICARLIRELSIKLNSAMQPVKSLSGGNQQKVVLAKILATECDILIIDEPTRGIDVGAKQEIYKLMREFVKQGKSIIMISSDMPELIGMSDRMLVMREGRIVKELHPHEYSQEAILSYASL